MQGLPPAFHCSFHLNLKILNQQVIRGFSLGCSLQENTLNFERKMWKELFYWLCIFLQLANHSAERIKINCCDIQKLIFRLECNSTDRLGIVYEGNIVRFQCLPMGLIIRRFH